MAELQRDNSFEIIGTLTEANVRNGVSKSGSEYVSVDATIDSVIGGKNKTFKVSFFANRLTAEKKESALFATYSKLPELKNRKVQLTGGTLRENRYWSTRNNQLASATQLSGRYIKGVGASVEDKATFEIGGFIVKELVEKTNKEGKVYRYDVEIAQSNYSGDNMSRYTLHVNPENMPVVNGVKGYQVGQTVKVSGVLDFYEETTVKESEDGGFGAPVMRTFTNTFRNFYIEHGSAAITDESAYTQAQVREFVAAYKAKDVTIQASAASRNAGHDDVEQAQPITQRQTSLI